METAEKREQYVYAPSRVYSHSRAATAEALPQEQPQRRTRPAETPKPKQSRNQRRGLSPEEQRELSRLAVRKVLSFFAVFAAAAVVICVLVRYAMISQEYTELNNVKKSITSVEQTIASLNVALNSAISLDDARDTALSSGLGYPTAEQVVRVGSAQTGGSANTASGEPQE